MNVGTIVEAPMVRVRLKGRRQVLGELEEAFVSWLGPGDVFQFAGRALRFEGPRDTFADVSLAPPGVQPTVPSYHGHAHGRSRPTSRSGCAAIWPSPRAGRACPTEVLRMARAAAGALGACRARTSS